MCVPDYYWDQKMEEFYGFSDRELIEGSLCLEVEDIKYYENYYASLMENLKKEEFIEIINDFGTSNGFSSMTLEDQENLLDEIKWDDQKHEIDYSFYREFPKRNSWNW